MIIRMKHILVLIAVLAAAPFTAPAQVVDTSSIRTFELLSVFDYSTDPPRSRPDRRVACVDLISLAQRCDTASGILYGTRAGVNWDILQIAGDQTRIVKIGKYAFADDFTVPVIEPWRKLEPGEKRTINVNTSGADGKHGVPYDALDPRYPLVREGYADQPINQQVSSTVTRPDGTMVRDAYSPYIQLEKGAIYAVRVFSRGHDRYVLIRVDDLKRGEKAVLSIVGVDAPSSEKEIK
jgi:hypothetical protein